MDVDQKTVEKIARLARLSISEIEARNFQTELSSILTWVEQLNAVDTGDIAPMTRVVDLKLPMRQDEVTDGGDAEAALANAPLREGNFYVVPKVVE